MGKFEVSQVAALPAGTTKEAAVALLHNHIAYLEASASYRSHTELPSPDVSKVPADIKARSGGSSAKGYTVLNESPNPITDSSVTSTYVIVDVADGIWYHAASPMGVTNEALWTVKEGASGLELSGVVQVECNLMLKSVVKGQVTSSTAQILEALLKKLQG